MKDKVLSLDELKKVSEEIRKEGKRIVHCHGVFDLLHPGHFKYLEAAKKFGDVLVVTLTEDRYVNKGPGRPIFNEQIRAETLAALGVVDYVAINRSPLAVPAIEAIQPRYYVKGQDYKNAAEDLTGGIVKERDAVEAHGGELVFTNEIQFSSSRLINRFMDQSDEDVKNFISSIQKDFGYGHFQELFEKISKLRVLVVGDTILDEYRFVKSLGQSSKSPNLTVKNLFSELYAGGVLAVANHIADFVDSVHLVSTYGLNEGTNYLEFIKESLHQQVEFHPLFTPDRPTTLKRRFVEQTFKGKMFEVYEFEDRLLNEKERNAVISQLEALKGEYDMILVADFGHGFIDREIVNYLVQQPEFLAVNTQTNSGNRGFNLLSKYPRCDYFSIDENEARLAAHEKFESMGRIFRQLIEQTQSEISAITLGRKGSMVGTQDAHSLVYAPIISNEVVDTIGAGDAYLAITALAAKAGASPTEIAFIGNAVGAMAVKIMGNKSYIEKVPLLKYLKTLLA